MEWEGWGGVGEGKMEREGMGVCVFGGGDFSVGERKWRRERTEGGEGCTCVFTGVCMCVVLQ